MDGELVVTCKSGTVTTYTFRSIKWWTDNNVTVTICMRDRSRLIIPWTSIENLKIVPNSNTYINWLKEHPEALPRDVIVTCDICHARAGNI